MQLRKVIHLFVVLALVLGVALVVPRPVIAAPKAAYIFNVNNAGDMPDSNPGNGTCASSGGPCTLRAAIQEVNALGAGNTFTIGFGGSFTIQPATPLPVITAGNVTIRSVEAYTVTLDGSNIPSGTYPYKVGLELASDNNKIQNLNITGFYVGIQITGNNNVIGTDGNNDGLDNVEGNRIYGNSYGVNVEAENTRVSGNRIGYRTGSGDAGNGIGVLVLGSNNIIGTNGDGVSDGLERNYISNNQTVGIQVQEGGGHVIAGNVIGLTSNGTALGNGSDGMRLAGDLSGNVRIGTDGNGVADNDERNYISGNGRHGIRVENSPELQHGRIIIANNFIGTDLTGTGDRGNTQAGVSISGTGVTGVIIGTNGDGNGDASEGNVISGNDTVGIYIYGADQCRIAGNKIGVNPIGTSAMPNTLHGIWLEDAPRNIIGTNGDGVSDNFEGNVISGNGDSVAAIGIFLFGAGSDENVIAGNTIGLNIDGTAAIPNTSDGVNIQGASTGNRIGTNGDGVSDDFERNIISGNGVNGVHIEGGDGHIVAGNRIGTSRDGVSGLGNSQSGVVIEGSAINVTIGTNADGVGDAVEGNLISGNTLFGINITGPDTDGNKVRGNWVGVNLSGQTALPNGGTGVSIQHGSDSNVIGASGDDPNPQHTYNVISGNGFSGIQVLHADSWNNQIGGNYVGLSTTGGVAVPNGRKGIYIWLAQETYIGDWYDANPAKLYIASNVSDGIFLDNAVRTEIHHTVIGLNNGGNPFPNGGDGIRIDNTAPGKIAYTSNISNNVIAHNTGNGVTVTAAGGSGHRFSMNAIYGNGGLGIDLGNDGVTANDAGDADAGANDLQNYPVMTLAAIKDNYTLQLAGTLNSAPSRNFTVEIYVNQAADPSGYGEGQKFLCAVAVTTNASGNATFSTTCSNPEDISTYTWVSALAIDETNGSTSEFSLSKTTTVLTNSIYIPFIVRP